MITKRSVKMASKFLGVLVAIFPIAISGQLFSDTGMSFNFGPRFQLGLNAFDSAYADLDGDGFLDVVAVNGGQGNPNPTITILFGTGDGRFGDTIVLPSYTIGHTIAVGDLNNDGLPEIVIASWYQNALAVFLNQGNRQFSLPVITIPPNPGSKLVGEYFGLAIADFDGDGNNDVVGLEDQSDQRLRFFHFNADGSLSVFATLYQQSGGTSYEAEMAVGDINGDGLADIVLIGGGPFGQRGMRFVFGQGPGGTLSITGGFSVVDRAVGISIKDLDNDGDNDIAVAFRDTTTPTRHSLQVFQNNGTGNFTALPKIFLEYPFPPTDITTDDFNNDGKQDIAALLSSVHDPGVMVLVLNGKGDGTFDGERYYAVSSSSSILSADVNQDGRIDILTVSEFGLGVPYSASVDVSTCTLSILFNKDYENFSGPFLTLWGPNFIDAGDFNNDGYTDLASAWATSVIHTSGVDILLNDRTGGLLPEVRQFSPTALNEMKTGDFNGDGKWDAVSAHEDDSRVLAIYLGNGDGTLEPPILTSFNRGLVNVIVGDFNSDGKDDVFVVDDTSQGYSMLSNGDGTLSVAPGSPMNMSFYIPDEIQKGDFNSDGKLDLVIPTTVDTSLWLGDGKGRFARSPVNLPLLRPVVAGDFNGDGKIDIAGLTDPPGPLPPWRTDRFMIGLLGDGNGGFSDTFSIGIRNFSHSNVQSIVSADFDVDGYDDVALIMKNNTFGNLIIVPSGGNQPSWREPIFYGVGTAMRKLVATDFNADGKPDIAFLGDNARGVIYNTTGTQARKAPFDFDGDGRTDVSIFRPSAGEWWYLRSSDGDNRAFTFGASTDVMVPGDYTGDGKADIAFFRPSTGEWFVLRSEDGSFFSFPFGGTGDIPAPADFDGDGRTDPAVFRPSTGTWFILRSSDQSVSIVSFGSASDQPVPVDFDGDGRADIAIYRPLGGTGGGEWWYLRSSDGEARAFAFGQPTDRALPADYTGDGKADVAFFRPSTGEWFILRSEDSSYFAFPFGNATDVPVPGDYDGDGQTDPAVFRPSTGTWFILGSTSGIQIVPFGSPGDQAVPCAYVR